MNKISSFRLRRQFSKLYQFSIHRSIMFRHIILLALCSCTLSQRTYLRADGDSDGTYALLNRILGGTAYEVPDCVHPIKHITQLNDAELGVHVFQFSSHVDIDNDRCQNFDRMRTEIKTYASSPSHMKCFLGESVSYSWDLRINSQFQPSTSFTHLFQIKAVDGDDSLPFITISPVLVSGQKVANQKSFGVVLLISNFLAHPSALQTIGSTWNGPVARGSS